MKRWAFFILWAALLLRCSAPNDNRISGTSNETQTVVGKVSFSSGTPVNNAAVILYNEKTLGIGLLKLAKIAAGMSKDSMKTDAKGFFRFDSVDTGKYYLEINYHDSLGAVQEAIVDTADTIHVNCTVSPMGAIEGKIDTGLISKTGKTYVYIVQIQQLVSVDSLTGAFEAVNLPPYSYTLAVLHDTTIIQSPLDSAKVSVNEGDTTHVGNALPVVVIGVDTTSGIAPLSVKIIYIATDPNGNPLSLFLNYGDGKIDTLPRATGSIAHIYSDTGAFKLVLIANDSKGGTGRDSVVIKVHLPLPSAPSLVLPLDGVINQPVSLSLIWNKGPFASSYYFQLSTDTGFTTAFSADSTLTDTVKAINGLANNSTYYWRVRAKNNSGTGAWSSRRSFTTIVAAPQTPTLTSPVDGASEQSVTPILTWSTVSGATTYDVQVSTVNTFATILLEDSMLASGSKTLSGLTDSTTYYWRVLAKNVGGTSAWTSPWSFTTIGLSSWTTRSVSTAAALRCVAWGNNKFVTAGGSDTIFASSDGITWAGQITGGINGFNGITFGNNQYVAVGQPCATCGTGSNGAIVTSPDAITWTSRTSGTPDWLPAVAWGDNQFIAVEWWLHISTDGITWTDNYSTNNGGQDHLDGITWGDSQFVAVGRTGLMYTSPDGNTWTKRTAITSNGLTSVTWANNKYVAVGVSGTILTSPDGLTWTNRTSGTSNNIYGVASGGNNQFVAVGDSGTVLTSPDGVTWTGQASGTSNTLYGIAFGSNKFVAVGANGTILTLP
jgi:hypothetical protein